jgi:hypothetical protein
MPSAFRSSQALTCAVLPQSLANGSVETTGVTVAVGVRVGITVGTDVRVGRITIAVAMAVAVAVGLISSTVGVEGNGVGIAERQLGNTSSITIRNGVTLPRRTSPPRHDR